MPLVTYLTTHSLCFLSFSALSVGLFYLFRKNCNLKKLALLNEAEEQNKILKTYQETFHNASIALMFVRKDGKVLKVNKTACEIFQIPEKNFLKKNLADLSHPEDKHKDEILFQKLYQADIPSFEIEKRYLRKDKEVIWVKQSAYFVDRDQNDTCVLQMKDITEDKKFMQELEVQKANVLYTGQMASLGEMASNIAHEINNPLTIINGSAALMGKILENHPEDIKNPVLFKKIDDIKSTTTRITKIINSLKNLSRGRQGEELETCTINEVIEDVLSLCKEKMRLNNITFTFQPNGFENQEIDCYRIQLSQVFMNLILNSIDAVVGTKDMSRHWIKLEINKIGNQMEFLLSDGGPGIPKEYITNVFTPFFTTKPLGKGTGLGLSLSKTIIEEHRGNLRILEDSPNTTFKITIPYQASSAAQTANTNNKRAI
ncbi:MAG: PAS domain S-box protein [Halobacteriovoraceae bacterium]|nr:PAS domain S-box protein [Halobacteriovoraceae bacterium]MCB9095138.1 PAS domain S-box protein [Halobacteriovoraceae bacterium]